ncbi:MAG: hypothetical protein JJT75_02525 [Opitutales bacterium]|nr:hypothetical protein [Opitutales bacterium]MCH8539268.1 hypothetical protein [Opitutales bacterium]
MKVSQAQDLRVEPFSRRGSYLSIRRMDAKSFQHEDRNGVFIRQCHGTRFWDPLVAGITVDGTVPESAWTVDCLRLYPAGKKESAAYVEIVFDGLKALRFRGQGCSLGLEFPTVGFSSMYPSPHGGWEVNARANRAKIQLSGLRGELSAQTDWLGEESSVMKIQMVAGPKEGDFELGFDFYHSTWIPRAFRPWADLRQEVDKEFQEFLAAFPPVESDWEESRNRAAYVNWSAVVAPHGHFRREAMLMSKVFMSNVWSWDHAFNAMAHFESHPQLAWDQMLLQADRQNEHGAFPDAQNDVHEHFNHCKPPIHGWAVSRMRRRRPEFFTEARIRETLAWLAPWCRWWLNHRLWKARGLPYYLHGNDSGWDNSTFFRRGVPLLGPDLPPFLILQCRELARLHELLNEPVDAAWWNQEADALKDKLLQHLWDGERFIALRMPEGEEMREDTLIETMPLVLGEELPAEIRKKVVGRLRRYLTEHGLATEYPESEYYRSSGYWRGPIWAPSTMLLIDGLARGGERTLAEEIKKRFLNLCRREGFAENYDALEGKALCDPAYTWTASVFLDLLHGDLGQVWG